MSDMIEVKRVRVPNELLIRFDVDGTPKGAHLVMLNYLQDGNGILDGTMRLEEAVPADYSGGAIAALLGDFASQLSAELAAKQMELDRATARIDALVAGESSSVVDN